MSVSSAPRPGPRCCEGGRARRRILCKSTETRRAAGRRVDSLAKWLLKFRIIAIPARIIASSNLAWSLVSRTDRIRTNRLRERIINDEIPKHVSIIMDGNRRFAWHRKIETNIGHEKGNCQINRMGNFAAGYFYCLVTRIPFTRRFHQLNKEGASNKSSNDI